MNVRTTMAVLLLVVGAMTVTSCSDSGKKKQPSPGNPLESPATTSSPETHPTTMAASSRLPVGSDAERLAAATAGDGNIGAVFDATVEALGRSGYRVAADETSVLKRETAPLAAALTPNDAAILALDAREHATSWRITGADLVQMLDDFGWQDASDPDLGVRAFIQGWVDGAIDAPRDPESFNALFFAGRAALQEPPIDLTIADWDPADLRLSLLDIEVFLASFGRGVAPPDLSQSDGDNGADGGARDDDGGIGDEGDDPPADLENALPREGIVLASYAPAATESPACTAMKQQMGTLGDWGTLGAQSIDTALPMVTSKYLEFNVSRAYGDSARESFGRVMSALGILNQLVNLARFYAQTNVAIVTDASSPMHKPTGSASPISFRGRVGVDDQTIAELQAHIDTLTRSASFGAAYIQSAADCLRTLGLPIPKDLKTLASDAEGWAVRWWLDGVPGFFGITIPPDQHVTIDAAASKFDGPQKGSGLTHNVRRKGQYIAETTGSLVLDVQPEQSNDHNDPSEGKSHRIYIEAEVLAQQPPSLSTLVGAAVGGPWGLAASLVETASGWFQTMLPPKSAYPFVVTYHRPRCDYGASGVAPLSRGGRLAAPPAAPVCNGQYAGTISATFHDETHREGLDETIDQQHTWMIVRTEHVSATSWNGWASWEATGSRDTRQVDYYGRVVVDEHPRGTVSIPEVPVKVSLGYPSQGLYSVCIDPGAESGINSDTASAFGGKASGDYKLWSPVTCIVAPLGDADDLSGRCQLSDLLLQDRCWGSGGAHTSVGWSLVRN